MIRIYGSRFVNSSLLLLSFNNYFVPAKFDSAEEISCGSPPYRANVSIRMEVTEGASNSTGEVGRDLFKFFHGFPSYLSKSVEVKVSMMHRILHLMRSTIFTKAISQSLLYNFPKIIGRSTEILPSPSEDRDLSTQPLCLADLASSKSQPLS
jgi:hypothetical protein